MAAVGGAQAAAGDDTESRSKIRGSLWNAPQDTKSSANEVECPRHWPPPPQLSLTMLDKLLEDLIEYNGFQYRPVPLWTFTDRHLGLYFSKLDDPACMEFEPEFRHFYQSLNEKFECILVSCDGTEKQYMSHTQALMQPTYPFCDLRPALLKAHFNVTKLPVLVVMDPNGVVVSVDGVSQVHQTIQFPWTERTVRAIWGPPARGMNTIWDRLRQLDLPVTGEALSTDSQDIIGLVFGEPWCPQTRNLLQRVGFLEERARKSTMTSSFYFVHAEPLENYDKFLGSWRSSEIPCIHLPEGDKRDWVLYLCDVQRLPAFYLISPVYDWTISNGVDWIERDPSGVYYPWVPSLYTGPEMDLDEVWFSDCVKELRREDLSQALCSGPVFVGVMDGNSEDWADVISNLRAVAFTYRHRIRHAKSKAPQTVRREDPVKKRHTVTVKQMVANPDKPEDFRPSFGLRQTMTVKQMAATLDKPEDARPSLGLADFIEDQESLTDTRGQLDGDTRSYVKRLRNAVMQGSGGREVIGECKFDRRMLSSTSGGGHSAWMCQDTRKPTRLSSLTFHYCSASDAVARILMKFCKYNEKHLLKKCASDERWMNNFFEMQTCIRRLGEELQGTADGNYSRKNSRSYSRSQTAAKKRGSVDSFMSTLSDGNYEDENGGSVEERRYVPLTDRPSLKQSSRDFFRKSSKTQNGTGLIIDVSLGTFHVCGNLKDTKKLIKFVDSWYEEDLHPFELTTFGPEEPERKTLMEHHKASGGVRLPQQLEEYVQVVPIICIWLPSFEHTLYSSNPEDIYKLMVDYAYQYTASGKVEATIFASCDEDDAMQAVTYQAERQETTARIRRRNIPSLEGFWIYSQSSDATADSNERRDSRTRSLEQPGAGNRMPAYFLDALWKFVFSKEGRLESPPAAIDAAATAAHDGTTGRLAAAWHDAAKPREDGLKMSQHADRAALQSEWLADLSVVFAQRKMAASVLFFGTLEASDVALLHRQLARSASFHVVGELEAGSFQGDMTMPQIHHCSWPAVLSMYEDASSENSWQ